MTLSEVFMSKRLRAGDTVIVLSGSYKGKIASVIYTNETHALVQGVNLRTHFVRRSEQHPQGGTIKREAPIALCKLRLCSPSTQKPVKLRARFNEGGRKEFYYIENGQEVFYRYSDKSASDSSSSS
jgi:large subunit ribosomal protein L24